MTMQKTANMSTEFLSSILCNQFLKMVSPKATDIQNFNTEINEEIIKNFQEISQSMPLEQLFYLLMYKTTDGSLIDKKLFLQSQKCSFPKVFEKVMNKKTSLYELRDGLLYKKIQNNFKLMLPGILIKNTFLRFHNKDLHDFDSYILQKLRENFALPSNSEQIRREAKTLCTVCQVNAPSQPKVLHGNKRLLTENATPGLVYFCDICHLNVNKEKYYVLLIVDTASSYVFTKLTKEISNQTITSFILDLMSIIGINSVVCSDGGPEFGGLLSEALTTLGIEHVKTSVGQSNQNRAESSIRLFRVCIHKLIAKYIQDQTKMEFLTLKILTVLATQIINSSPPYRSAWKRSDLFFGLVNFSREMKLNKLLSEEDIQKLKDQYLHLHHEISN